MLEHFIDSFSIFIAVLSLSFSIILTFLNFIKLREQDKVIKMLEKENSNIIKDFSNINKRIDSLAEFYLKILVEKDEKERRKSDESRI